LGRSCLDSNRIFVELEIQVAPKLSALVQNLVRPTNSVNYELGYRIFRAKA